MACLGIESLTDTSIEAILTYPTSCDFFFYLKILGGFFFILTMSLFTLDRQRETRANFLSSAAVGALATVFLALIGTVVGFVSGQVFTLIFVVTIVIVGLWWLSSRD